METFKQFSVILILCSLTASVSSTCVPTSENVTTTTTTLRAPGSQSWTNLEVRAGTPGLAIWNGNLQLIARALQNAVYISLLSPPSWKRWETPDSVATSDMSSSSAPGNAAYVVATTDDFNHVVLNEWTGSSWTQFQTQGMIAEDVAVSVFDSDHVFLVARGFDNELYLRRKYEGVWFPWKNIGGYFVSKPDVVAVSKTRMYVAANSKYNFVQFNVYDGDGTLVTSKGLDFYATSAPAIVVTQNGARVDLFVRGEDFALWTVRNEDVVNDGDGWMDWVRIGGAFASGPAALATGEGTVDVVAPDCNNWLHHLEWEM